MAKSNEELLTGIRSLDRDAMLMHPVWKFAENREKYVPVVPCDPLPGDDAPFFIRARFEVRSGCRFEGYLVGTDSFYAFFLFTPESTIGFNVNAPQFYRRNIQRLRQELSQPSLELFPLRYKDDVRFQNQDRIMGVLDWRKRQG